MKNSLIQNLFLLMMTAFVSALPVSAQMMSSNIYAMQSDSINFASSNASSSSATYGLENTVGESVAGQSGSTSYGANAGYQYMFIDTSFPSAPAGLTTQVISSSEVELSWDQATDDYGIERYYIYRDNVRVADAAIFPRDYTDSGLLALTSYDYNVSAVDMVGHEGPRTATSTVTTTATPIPTQSTPSSSGGTRTVVISNLEIRSNDTNATLSFSTSLPRHAEIYWGTNNSYGSGHLVGTDLESHFFILDNLSPQTSYYLKIVLKDDYGNEKTFEDIRFRTLAVAVSAAPTNVRNFKATASSATIDLSWKMPNDTRVVGARVVRSDKSFPSTPSDGEVIFKSVDGTRPESFSDTSVKVGTQYYYAIFTEDLAGNLSSGVLATAKILLPGQVNIGNPLDTLLPAGKVDPKIEKLTIKDFLFIQSGDSLSVTGDSVAIDGAKNLTVALQYYRVPPVLKTIAVTLVTGGANSERFTFILRPNRDKTRYEATIAPLGEDKTYNLRIDVVDFKNQGLKTLRGTVEVKTIVVKPAFISGRVKQIGGLGVLSTLIVLLTLYFVRMRLKKAPLLNTAQ